MKRNKYSDFNNLSTIFKYLKDELSLKEKFEFEERMLHEPTLKEEVEIMKWVRRDLNILKTYPEYKNLLKRKKASYKTQQNQILSSYCLLIFISMSYSIFIDNLETTDIPECNHSIEDQYKNDNFTSAFIHPRVNTYQEKYPISKGEYLL